MEQIRNEDNLDQQQQQPRVNPPELPAEHSPRCNSSDIKFCYYNNYNLSQPCYFCKTCRRYWTHSGTLRNIPIGSGCRRGKGAKTSDASSSLGNDLAETTRSFFTAVRPLQNYGDIFSGQLSRAFPPLHVMSPMTNSFQGGGSTFYLPEMQTLPTAVRLPQNYGDIFSDQLSRDFPSLPVMSPITNSFQGGGTTFYSSEMQTLPTAVRPPQNYGDIFTGQLSMAFPPLPVMSPMTNSSQSLPTAINQGATMGVRGGGAYFGVDLALLRGFALAHLQPQVSQQSQMQNNQFPSQDSMILQRPAISWSQSLINNTAGNSSGGSPYFWSGGQASSSSNPSQWSGDKYPGFGPFQP